jgi:hypothetical protein
MRLRAIWAGAMALLFAACSFSSALAAAGVSADLTTRVQGTYSGTATDAGTAVFPFDLKAFNQLSAGTGAGKGDKLYFATRTLAASASENLDLAGVLADPLGATLTFGHVKAIMIVASAANTNNVNVGGHASAAFVGPFADATDILSIPPGGSVLLVHPGAGWAVTATTADMVKVANSSSGTGVSYSVLLAGTSN